MLGTKEQSVGSQKVTLVDSRCCSKQVCSLDIEQACNKKWSKGNILHCMKMAWKQNQNRPMETTKTN